MLEFILKYLPRKVVSVSRNTGTNSTGNRRWRLWQIEPAITCNLKCVMCPWDDARNNVTNKGYMSEEIWGGLSPHLEDVQFIDFTGGGEPLLQKHLLSWITQAKGANCNVGFLSNGSLLNPILSQKIIDSGIDWIGFSVDGADQFTYELIRQGSNFDKLCTNIKKFTDLRTNKHPLVMINFVIMTLNYHQLGGIINLAKRLGADQVNFKQCDVIRGKYGKNLGLFGVEESKQIKQLQKELNKASRLARKLGIKITSFSFVPKEQPVCDQDPRDSLFISYDGTGSPCINLAIGGSSTFLDKDVIFPHISYGNLLNDEVLDLWGSELCCNYRSSFEQRVTAHDNSLASADLGHDIIKLKEALRAAVKAMPEAREGCRTCHYLYGI